MKDPLFAIGELVIRQGKHYPQIDGEWVIEDIISLTTLQQIHPRIVGWDWPDTWYYKLEGMICEIRPTLVLQHSGETNLRKKHIPGEWTFDKLMDKLDTPILEDVK